MPVSKIPCKDMDFIFYSTDDEGGNAIHARKNRMGSYQLGRVDSIGQFYWKEVTSQTAMKHMLTDAYKKMKAREAAAWKQEGLIMADMAKETKAKEKEARAIEKEAAKQAKASEKEGLKLEKVRIKNENKARDDKLRQIIKATLAAEVKELAQMKAMKEMKKMNVKPMKAKKPTKSMKGMKANTKQNKKPMKVVKAMKAMSA
jgi:hypothetical protein